MKINFQYDKEKDIWCLLNKGKSSNNSSSPTKQYEQLVERYGENPTSTQVAEFVDDYIRKNNLNIVSLTESLQKDWQIISEEFERRAESIFNVRLNMDINVYLTVNSRCPYSIVDNSFYISMQSKQARKTIMHELWHFYTWYGLGVDEEATLGKSKYNNLKESLTVLLNVECKDLLPDGVMDAGYPQHQSIRENILQFWAKNKNISNLWEHFKKLN
jgi:hypothetical protein